MTTESTSRTVFLTGATGAMGLSITRTLVEAGHNVRGVARSEAGAEALRALGATPVEVDLFDPAAVSAAVKGADVIAHFATKIPEGMAAAKPDNWLMNDRLRREGTRILLAAARAKGVRRFIFESFHGAYPDNGDAWIDEGLPLRPVAPVMQSLLDGEALVNEFGAAGGEAVILRYARIYGPGRASDSLIEMFRKRQMPIVGAGKNYVSSIHIDDVGSAVVAALTAPPGTYNVGDDEPMRQADVLRSIAAAIGAPSPRRFREATGWRPAYPSAREGWSAVAAPAGAESLEAVAVS